MAASNKVSMSTSHLSRWCLFSLIWCFQSAIASGTCDDDGVSCAASKEDIVVMHEQREAEALSVELLQGRQTKQRNVLHADHEPDKEKATRNDEHHYLLVRPCARLAGDGVSGLPRHRVTGECCGDAVCSTARWEDFSTCPQDCTQELNELTSKELAKKKKALPPTQSALFGTLQAMEHDEYHCEAIYGTGEEDKCSQYRTDSWWLQNLIDRAGNGTLGFDMPPPGSVALELGAGRGQDSLNLASMAGFRVTSVDVSPGAIEQAKQNTPSHLQGAKSGQIEFIAYDAMALPAPQERIDFIFDATVYCGLRHKYLARDYDLWSRLATPGHTLVNIQCWSQEASPKAVARKSWHDMSTDFEPIFDVLHSEACPKNQGGPGWCFYMKLKTPEAVKKISEDRLKMQQEVIVGNIEYVKKLGKLSEGERRTLYYVAMANNQLELMAYLGSPLPGSGDDLFRLTYGHDALKETVEDEDRLDGSTSELAQFQMASLKADWETAETELLLSLQNETDDLEGEDNHAAL